MSYSPKSKGAKPPAGILAGADFPADRTWEQGDFSNWVELMEAVEALCPVWPERAAIREEGAVYKL